MPLNSTGNLSANSGLTGSSIPSSAAVPPPFFPAVMRLFLATFAAMGVLGWTLSILHQFTATGYAVGLVLLVAVLAAPVRSLWPSLVRQSRLQLRRFSHPLAFVYLLVAALVLLAGVLNPPSNYDALTYRLPRLLHWLHEGHWYWIQTPVDRMNYMTLAWDWIAAPQLALLHSDRTLFLINFTMFLLLPGMLFSVFRAVKVPGRVARQWMWAFPLAYGYVAQAGGVANDFPGTFFALAAIYFGLRARCTGQVVDVWLAFLAMALLSAAKISNLPLLLPAFWAVWPALRLLWTRRLATVGVIVVALVISMLPTAVLNTVHCGAWAGDPHDHEGVRGSSPLAAMAGNCILFVHSAIMPPCLPNAQRVAAAIDHLFPPSFMTWINHGFHRYHWSKMVELPAEDDGQLGLGLSLSVLAILTATAVVWRRTGPTRRPMWNGAGLILGFCGLFALLVFMSQMAVEGSMRLALPYFPVVFVLVALSPGAAVLARSKLWQAWLVISALGVLPMIFLSPSRPLLPVVSISRHLLERNPQNAFAQRTFKVYSVYANRNDGLKVIRDELPAEVQRVGLAAGENDSEYSLERPFGRREVVWLTHSRDLSQIDLPDDIEWVVVRRDQWKYITATSFDDWCRQNHMRVVHEHQLCTLVGQGDGDWLLLHREPGRSVSLRADQTGHGVTAGS